MAEILLSWGPGEIRLALVEQERPVEFSIIRPETLTGAVLLGRVAESAPRFQAAFVHLGGDVPGFLPGGQGMVQGEAVLVQVRADAQGGKGPLLTADVSLAGRYLAYSPFRPGINISRRLDKDVRQTLSRFLETVARPGEGIVARTAAAHADQAELTAELEALRADWQKVEQARAGGAAPALLYRPDPLSRLLSANPHVERVWVDDAETHAALRCRYGGLVALSRQPAFHLHDVEEAFQAALEPVVPLPGGGRLTIEPTAALTAMDVDSGLARPVDANARAVEEIARQLRLRGIGGQVVVDFVSAGKGSAGKLAAVLKQAVASDPVPTHVFGTTPLGLVEMTRERRGPSLAELMLERSCHGNADAQALAALRQILVEAAHRPGRALALRVPRPVASALARRSDAVAQAEQRLGRKLNILPDPALGPEEIIVQEV